MNTKPTDLPDLETSIKEITKLIEQMEKGDLTLDKSLVCFERGIHLIKHSHKILEEAEQKVQILLQQNGEEKLEDYENTEE